MPVDGGYSVCGDEGRLTRSSSVATSPNATNNATNVHSKTKKQTSYDVRRVSDLIATRRLAPFYEGSEEQGK